MYLFYLDISQWSNSNQWMASYGGSNLLCLYINFEIVLIIFILLIHLFNLFKIISSPHTYAPYYTCCHNQNMSFFYSFIQLLRCQICRLGGVRRRNIMLLIGFSGGVLVSMFLLSSFLATFKALSKDFDSKKWTSCWILLWRYP